MPECISCRRVNADDARYCAYCGTPLVESNAAPLRQEVEERRYCTVIFCDLIESTTLSQELDAEDYGEAIRIVHESSASIISRYGGEVSNYPGDGVLAVFGYPHAHENDAGRAVRAVLEMQAAIASQTVQLGGQAAGLSRQLHSRAAVHTGDVVFRKTGLGTQRRIVLYGETVNTTERLHRAAAPDSVLISAATRRLIGEMFELERKGQPIVNRAMLPFETFRVVSVRPAAARHDSTRRGESTPLVGRTEQLAGLANCWEKVVAGHGATVVITGEPGIGKSRLLTAARQTLGLEHCWFEFRGSQYHASSELHPFLEVLRVHLVGAGDALAGADESLRPLASLLALPQRGDDQPPLLLPDEQRRRILDSMAQWIWRLAADSPVAIVVEDLQWVDPTSMQLLDALVSTVDAHRVLLLLTCRSAFDPPWQQRGTELRLALEKLSRDEAQTLVESIAIGRRLPDHTMRDVLAKSDGVPLFLEEVTRMLIDSESAIASVPESLRDLLAARLDRLPSHALETLQLGAVIGRRFPRELLAAVSTNTVEEIDRDIAVLLNSGVIVREDRDLSFKHVLLRDTAYDRMLHGKRDKIHGRVALTLLQRFPQLAETQPELIAHHLAEAGDDSAAIREWSRAGERSLRNGAYLEAVHHFQHALALHERTMKRTGENSIAYIQNELRLRKDLGVSLIATQGYTSAAVADNYERALRQSSKLQARDEDIPIHVLYGLWGTCLVRGDRNGTDQLAKYFQRVEGSTDPLARHVAHSTLGARAFYRGDFATAMAQCERAMQLYKPAEHFVLMRDYGYEGGIYSHLYVACLLCFTGYPDRALAAVDQALELSVSIGDPYAKAVSLGMAACIARERGEPRRTKTLSEELVTLAAERQFVMWLGIAHCLHGWAVVAEGDIQTGTEEVTYGLGVWEATGAKVPGTYLRLCLIDAELAGGNIDAGLASVECGFRQCRTTLESYQLPEYHRLKGELLRLSGNTEAAAAEMRRALKGAQRQRAAWVELRAAMSLARLLHQNPEQTNLLMPLVKVLARLTEGTETPVIREAVSILANAGMSTDQVRSMTQRGRASMNRRSRESARSAKS